MSDSIDSGGPASAAGPPRPLGIVRGVVRSISGHPVSGCSLSPVPVSFPHPPVPEMAWLSGADGSYMLTLPPATYTITANTTVGDKAAHAEVRGIEVTDARPAIVDITVA